jgi:hypothetical protein
VAGHRVRSSKVFDRDSCAPRPDPFRAAYPPKDPELAGDLTVARDFDLGMTGPPMHINMDFIAGGLVEMIARL